DSACRFWRASCARFTHGRVHDDREEIIWTPGAEVEVLLLAEAGGRGVVSGAGPGSKGDRRSSTAARIAHAIISRARVVAKPPANLRVFPSRRRRHGSCFSRCHVWRQPSRRGSTMRGQREFGTSPRKAADHEADAAVVGGGARGARGGIHLPLRPPVVGGGQ